MLGPLLLAFVARIENDHPRVPPHEQWLAAGGALSNFLTALHVMGFGAKMLSGQKAGDPVICEAFCEPGEILVGWIAAGTASKAPHPRENDNPDAVLRRWQPPDRLTNTPQNPAALPASRQKQTRRLHIARRRSPAQRAHALDETPSA